MIVDLLPLINNTVNSIDIDKSLEIPKEYYEKTDIRRLSEIKINGNIKSN